MDLKQNWLGVRDAKFFIFFFASLRLGVMFFGFKIGLKKLWLGDRDSNPDQMVQSHPSYH